MARFCNLFSGSGGNCTYIGGNDGGILIDAGVSCKRIETALMQRNIDPKSIRAIFVTHEHNDHISGVRVFATKNNAVVYATEGTLAGMDRLGIINGKYQTVTVDRSHNDVAGMDIIPFDTMHDTPESCGYIIHTSDDRKIAVATDIGFVTDTVRQALTGCDLVLIESNHDVHMLRNGNYPYYLKQRIFSATGHLSNESCADELPSLAQNGTTRFYLGHLSHENNLPQIAYNTSLNRLVSSGLKLGRDFMLKVCAPQSISDVEVF